MALKHKNLNELFTAICDEVRRLSGRPSDMAIDFSFVYIPRTAEMCVVCAAIAGACLFI